LRNAFELACLKKALKWVEKQIKKNKKTNKC
jgi:hypothetical protein